jgi:hypothetical protein
MSSIPPPPPGASYPGQPLKTSALAVWSLVLGILGLVTCLPAVPGLILGIIGLQKAKPENGLKGKGMAIAGVVLSSMVMVLFPVIAILASISIPAFTAVAERAKVVQSMNNVKQLEIAMREFSMENGVKFPKDWEAISKYLESNGRELLTSPLGNRDKTYVLLLPNGSETLPADTPFILDPNRTRKGYVVGFVDGSVREVPLPECQALKHKLKEMGVEVPVPFE